MNALNRHLPLLRGSVGVVLLIRGITHLRDAMPALLMPSATAEAYGYAFGQSLGVSVQLAAGVGLVPVAARKNLAGLGAKARKNSH